VKAHAILLSITLFAFPSARDVCGGELTDAVKASRLTGGVILLVNASSDVYDETAAILCTVSGLETDPVKVDFRSDPNKWTGKLFEVAVIPDNELDE